MKPLSHPLVPDRGHGRTPAVLLLIDERDNYLREAARRYCVGMSDRQAAAMLRTALSRYRDGRWRRDRTEATCPPKYAGTITALLWLILKTRDVVPSDRLIRLVLARR